MTPFPREAYRRLRRYDPGRRPVEVDLSDNTNLWGPHPGAVRAVREAGGEAYTRYPSVYADPLKEAIAERFGVPREAVVTGCGSDDLLDSALRAVCDPGERVVYPEPTFSMVESFCRMNGLAPHPVPGAPEAALDAVLDPEPAAIYLCSPNNPTGASVEDEVIRGLARRADGPVILLDEAYADFAGESRTADAPGTRRLVSVRTLSKAFGLAGLRVGFAVGPPALMAEIEKSRGPYKVGRLSERAAVAAIRDPDGWVDERVRRIVENRRRLAGGLREAGLEPLPSDANFVLAPVSSPAEAVARALRARGIGVRAFSDLPGVGDAIRITVGPRELVERFLDALPGALDEAASP